MLTPPALLRGAVHRLDARDPERDGLRRAVRAAVIVPIAAAVSFRIGASQTPLFTIFGSFALMVLADFPGDRQNRAVAYAGLGFNGAVLITVGTLVAPVPWLAVTAMFLLGIAVTFAGVLSETIAAGQRATLLTFVLPACTPPGPISDRLLGWAIALAICVPASLFLLPPSHHDELRRHAAQVCGALADRMAGNASAPEVAAAMNALRSNFLGADFRPVGLDRGASRSELATALAALRSVARGRYREDIVQVLGERDDEAAVAVGRPAQQLAHRVGTCAGRCHHTPVSGATRVLGGARRDVGTAQQRVDHRHEACARGDRHDHRLRDRGGVDHDPGR